MIEAKRIDWPKRCPAKLRAACKTDFEIIKEQVESGISHLYKVTSEKTSMYLVTRGELTPIGKALVVVCVGGSGIKDTGDLVIQEAKRLGFDYVRYHCTKAAHRLYAMNGFGGEEIERVYHIPLGVSDGG